jgi:VCBS repeat-containing protein
MTAATVDPAVTAFEVFEDAIGGVSTFSFEVATSDDDPGETGVTVTHGAYGTVTHTDPNSPTTTVTYTLTNGLDVIQLLAAGGTLTDTFDIVSLDGSVTKTITVTIRGSDGVQIDGTNSADLNLVGTLDRETIDGKAGNDVFKGHLAGDTLIGGTGNDEYQLGDHVPAAITEAGAGGGTDTITTTTSRSLEGFANVENLTLLGSGTITGTGSALANTLDGSQNSAANELTGLGGNDTYILGEGDTAVEAADGGTDTVRTALSHVLAVNVENLELLGTEAITGTGNALANSLNGRNNSAANLLMGLAGNDRYVIGAGDIVDETAAGSDGTDTVEATFTYTLGAGVENLELSGTGDKDGTGNELANRLTGSSGINVLTGLAGNDIYIVGAGDTVVEGVDGGTDLVVAGVNWTLAANVENFEATGAAATSVTGNSLGNQMVGKFATGANEFTGLGGNDVYFLGAGDTVVEAAGGGTDIVVVEFSYTLGSEVEQLILRGTAEGVSGTGNELANRLDGFQHTGANTLTGLAGNDTYIIGAGDIVVEGLNGGTDLVGSHVTHTLGANVENLALIGTAAIAGTGNAMKNLMDGSQNSGGNLLRGMNGDDTYILGAGDRVQETAAGGTGDVVRSLVNHTLGANVEHLVLISTVNQNGTGNTLANQMFGNAFKNTLDGGLGNDVLSGNDGNDILIGNLGADFMTGGKGNDIFRFAKAADSFGKVIDGIADFDDPGKGNDVIDVTGMYGARMTYMHDKAFTKAGQVRINDIKGADVLVEINTSGSLAADFVLVLKSTTLASMAASDFVL